MDVTYNGCIEAAPGTIFPLLRVNNRLGGDKSFWLRGKWNNEKGGCYGNFFCRQQPSQTSSHICICDVCNDAIKPGQTRWNCIVCTTQWNCCSTCQSREEARNHPHPLQPETMHSVSIAKGTTTTDVVLNAFAKFSARNFIGVRKHGEKEFRYDLW